MLVTSPAPERNDEEEVGGRQRRRRRRRRLGVRVEVTLTGVCHCPRQIISSTARYTHSPPPPQTFLGTRKTHAPVRASAFVPAARIMHPHRYAPPSHPEGWSSAVHFPVQRTHPARALLATALSHLRHSRHPRLAAQLAAFSGMRLKLRFIGGHWQLLN